VRRLQALVGQDVSFDHGREQIKRLAGLELTAKSVERVAESIGADIARCEQAEIDRAVQLDLPLIVGEPVPILYIELDGTGVLFGEEGNGGSQRQARWPARAHARTQSGLRVHPNQVG